MAKKTSPEFLKLIDEHVANEFTKRNSSWKDKAKYSYTVKHIVLDKCEYDYIRVVEKFNLSNDPAHEFWHSIIRHYFHYDGSFAEASIAHLKEFKKNHIMAQNEVTDEKIDKMYDFLRERILFKRSTTTCLNPGSYYPNYECKYIDFDGTEKVARWSEDATRYW